MLFLLGIPTLSSSIPESHKFLLSFEHTVYMYIRSRKCIYYFKAYFKANPKVSANPNLSNTAKVPKEQHTGENPGDQTQVVFLMLPIPSLIHTDMANFVFRIIA